MSKIITIRIDESLRKALEERAQSRGITLSQMAYVDASDPAQVE